MKGHFWDTVLSVYVVVYVFRSSRSLRPADVGAGQQSSAFLILRAETTVTSILNVIYFFMDRAYLRVTTCLENREMSGNLTAVREMSGILLKVREVSGTSLVNDTSTEMIWVTFNMGMSAGNCHGNVGEFQIVWRALTLYLIAISYWPVATSSANRVFTLILFLSAIYSVA